MTSHSSASGTVGSGAVARAEVTLFFGSSALAIVVGSVVVLHPQVVLPCWWAWVLLVDGPHVLATWTRTYLDGEEWARRRRLLLGSLLLLLAGPTTWALASWSAHEELLDGFILASTLWSVHHFVRQHHGVLALLGRREAATPEERRQDSRFVHVTLWAVYGLFLLHNAQNRVQAGLPAVPTVLEQTAMIATVSVIVVATGTHVSMLLHRHRRNRPVLAAAYAIACALGVTLFGYIVVGDREPLVARPRTLDHRFLGLSLVVGLNHGIQYLGLVASTSRRRALGRHGQSRWKKLALRPWLGYSAVALVSLTCWGALNAASGLAPNAAPLGFDTGPSRLFLAIYWSFFLHHFYLDQHIWHVGSDRSLQADLALEGQS